MHGAIVHSLGKYIQATHGPSVLADVLAESAIADTRLMPTRPYADADVLTVLQGVVRRTGQPVAAVLEGFGEYLAPILLEMYGTLLDWRWRTLEVIENTESTIHRAVRIRDASAAPPLLHVERTGPAEVTIAYASSRRMCHLAIGIARGIAAHFRERIEIEQPTCMHRHDERCLIVIRRLD